MKFFFWFLFFFFPWEIWNKVFALKKKVSVILSIKTIKLSFTKKKTELFDWYLLCQHSPHMWKSNIYIIERQTKVEYNLKSKDR